MSYFMAERARTIEIPSGSFVGVHSGFGVSMNYGCFSRLVNFGSWKPDQCLWDECTGIFEMVAHLEFWLTMGPRAPFHELQSIRGIVNDTLLLLEPDRRRSNADAIAFMNEVQEDHGIFSIGLVARLLGSIRGDDANKRWERAAELVICDIIRKHIPVHPGLMKGV